MFSFRDKRLSSAKRYGCAKRMLKNADVIKTLRLKRIPSRSLFLGKSIIPINNVGRKSRTWILDAKASPNDIPARTLVSKIDVIFSCSFKCRIKRNVSVLKKTKNGSTVK